MLPPNQLDHFKNVKLAASKQHVMVLLVKEQYPPTTTTPTPLSMPRSVKQ